MGRIFLSEPKLSGINTSDATIIEKDVSYNKIAYGTSGKIIGTAAFNYIQNNQYEWTQPNSPVILSNEYSSVKLIKQNEELVLVPIN